MIYCDVADICQFFKDLNNLFYFIGKFTGKVWTFLECICESVDSQWHFSCLWTWCLLEFWGRWWVRYAVILRRLWVRSVFLILSFVPWGISISRVGVYAWGESSSWSSSIACFRLVHFSLSICHFLFLASLFRFMFFCFLVVYGVSRSHTLLPSRLDVFSSVDYSHSELYLWPVPILVEMDSEPACNPLPFTFHGPCPFTYGLRPKRSEKDLV